MLMGEPVSTKARSNGFRVSLLAGAVAGAFGLVLSQSAFAVEVIGSPTLDEIFKVGNTDLSVVRVYNDADPNGTADALVHGAVVKEDFTGSLTVNALLDQEIFNSVRGTNGFDTFGQSKGSFDTSYLSGVAVFNSRTSAVTLENASISAEVKGLSGNPYVEVAGVTQYNGSIAFTGATTTISSSSDLQSEPSRDWDSVVYGFEIENPIGKADWRRTATFSADTTTITATSTAEAKGLNALGVYFAADSLDVPAITFARGDTTVTAENKMTSNEWAYGILMHNSDGNSVDTDAKISVNEGASLTINAKGGETVGIYADDGVFVSDGTLTINANGLGKDTVGIFALGNANLTFNGTTTVTATTTASDAKAKAYALRVQLAEQIPEGMIEVGQVFEEAKLFPTRENFNVTFNGVTTLTGDVYVGNGMTVTMNNDQTTVNGNLVLKGRINGEGQLTLNGGGTIGNLAVLAQEVLTFQSGTFESAGRVRADTITIGSGVSLEVTGGTLTSSSSQFFTNSLGDDGKTTDAGELKAGLTVTGGTLVVNDAKWNLDYSKYVAGILSQNRNAGTATFTGELVDSDGQTVTELNAGDVDAGFSATSVNVKVSENIDKNIGSKSISVQTGETVKVKEGNTVTLFGSANSNGQELVQFENGTGATSVEVAGTLQLGGTAVSDLRGTISHEVKLQEGAAMNVDAGTFHVDTVSGTGTIEVGNDESAGTLTVANLSHEGLIFLDPSWKDGEEIEDGSFLTAEDFAADGKLNAQIVVGQNSTVVFGGTKDEAIQAFAQTGLNYGGGIADDVTAVFYTAKAFDISDSEKAVIRVDGSLTSAPKLSELTTGSFTVATKGLVMIDGEAIPTDKEMAAITASTITFAENSHIRIVNLGKDKMSGRLFKATSTADDALIIPESVKKDAWENSGIYRLDIDVETGTFTAEEVAASEAFPTFYGTAFLERLREVGIKTDATDPTQAFLSLLNYHVGMTAKQASDIGNQAMALAATAGVYNVALDSSKLMNRSLERRMTLADNFDRTNGVMFWADVFGTTNQADSLYGDGGYDMDLYGGVLGADVEVVPGAVLGAALTVGTGDGGSKDAAIDVDNDADFFGLSVYGSHRIGNCNGMIDIGWMHTKSDLSATAFGMSIGDEVKADAFTIGFGAEHLMKFGSVNVVPHVGIRWTRLDVDGYEGAFKTDDDTMNIFTLPIGVAFSGNLNAGGWKLAPMVDLAVVPSFGDDEAESKVRWQGVSETVKTQVVDDAPFQASLGINAQNGNWTIGASYDLGVGGDDRLDNAFTVRARYAF